MQTETSNPGARGLIALFALLLAVSFVLRIFYAGYLYQDDGLWFTAAEQILRGKALYREIYFDKPPVLPLLYALLFKLCGPHILAVRLFTILYAACVSVLLYFFGTWLYDKRAGVISAIFFAFFSTTSVSGHVQGLNTDFLMVLPYTAGAYLLMRSQSWKRCGSSAVGRSAAPAQSCRGADLSPEYRSPEYRSPEYRSPEYRMWPPLFAHASLWLALAGGALTGLATQTNPKGAVNLIFFAVLLLLARDRHKRGRPFSDSDRRAVHSARELISAMAFAGIGFAIGSAPFLLYIAATKSLTVYWQYVWVWGSRYAGYYSAGTVLSQGLRLIGSYFALNNTLFFMLVLVTAVNVKDRLRVRGNARRSEALSDPRFPGLALNEDAYKPDRALLLWLALSFVALATGGRFFAHYFFQILPALCLIGGRGILLLIPAGDSPWGIGLVLERLSRWTRGGHGGPPLQARDLNRLSPRVSHTTDRRGRLLRRLGVATLALGFIITVVRFHTRTARLGIGWITGRQSAMNADWFHQKLNHEERMAAAEVRDLQYDDATVDGLGPEALRRADRPTVPGPADYLFIWGYRPEIYYWSGLIPASRYLSAQPLTGVPADVQYENGQTRSLLDEKTTASARIQLLEDLNETQPLYIIDEVGMFNSELPITAYPELREFMKQYKPRGAVGRFMVYRKRTRKE